MTFATEQMAKARWDKHGSAWPDGHRECTKCGEIKPTTQFHKHRACKGGFNSVCKVCRVPVSQKHHQQNPHEKRLFNAAKTRATAKGREFSIELSDIQIPELCPVFKTPMVSPSLDRIDSSKGYVKGNVRVISKRANQLKSNATVEEMEMVLADLIHLRKSVCEIL